jgi:predicted ATPase
LPFIVVPGDGPLIIDEPEQQAGKLLINEWLGPQIAHVSRHRQVIITSHDQNLPLASSVEYMCHLVEREGRGEIACAGPLADMARSNERVLDGGPEAFQARMRFYGYEKKSDR